MNKKKVLLPIVLLALGIGGFVALKASRPKPPVAAPQEPVWRVEAMTVAPASMAPVLTLNGRVESPDQTQAAAPGVGRVLSVAVREGQAVAKGQLLLALDPRDFLPKVAQARADVMELDAAIRSEQFRHQADLDQLAQEQKLQDFAAADVARFEQLQKENFYSRSAVDQSRSNLSRQQISVRSRELAIADHAARLAQLKARLARAQANLDQAALAYARSRVAAPFAGYVAKVEAAAGDQVNTGQTLVSLYPSAGLEVRAKLPSTRQASFLDALRRGERLRAVARIAGVEHAFRLSRTAGAADASGLDAFFTLEGGGNAPRVGELVSLEVSGEPVPDVIAIPYAALFGGTQVYRIEVGRLRAVAVRTVGDAGGVPARLLVRSPDLKAGDRLLLTHLPNAVTGLKVEPIKP